MKRVLVLLVVCGAVPLGAKELVWQPGTVVKLGFTRWCPGLKPEGDAKSPPARAPVMLPAGSSNDLVCQAMQQLPNRVFGPTVEGASVPAIQEIPNPETQFLEIDGVHSSYVVKWQALETSAIIDVLPGSKVEYAVEGKHLLLRLTGEGPRHKRLREQPHGPKNFWWGFEKYKMDIVAANARQGQ